MINFLDFGIYFGILLSSLLSVGMAILIVCVRKETNLGVVYIKMLQQWIGAFSTVFSFGSIGKILLVYLYIPQFLLSIPMAIYYCTVVLICIFCYIVYGFLKKNIVLSKNIWYVFFTAVCIGEYCIIMNANGMFLAFHGSFSLINNPIFWLFIARLAPYSLLVSSLVLTLWSIIRRNKDNFGRDYYIFALQYCTHISYIAVIGLTIISIINAIVVTISIERALLVTPTITLLIVPLFVFLYLAYSFRRIRTIGTNPLQYRFSFISSLFLSLMALITDAYMLHGYSIFL